MTLDRPKETAASEPHPEIVALIEQMKAAPTPVYSSLSPERAREFLAAKLPESDEPTPVEDVLALLIGDQLLRIRVYVSWNETVQV